MGCSCDSTFVAKGENGGAQTGFIPFDIVLSIEGHLSIDICIFILLVHRVRRSYYYYCEKSVGGNSAFLANSTQRQKGTV